MRGYRSSCVDVHGESFRERDCCECAVECYTSSVNLLLLLSGTVEEVLLRLMFEGWSGGEPGIVAKLGLCMCGVLGVEELGVRRYGPPVWTVGRR